MLALHGPPAAHLSLHPLRKETLELALERGWWSIQAVLRLEWGIGAR